MSVFLDSRTALNQLCVPPRLTFNLAPGRLRKETEGDERFFVVPAVILKEMVLSGSGGPLFYPRGVIQKSASEWEGVPVTLGHPKSEEGQPVSVLEPSDAVIIGEVRSPQVKEDQLEVEVWLYFDSLRASGKGLLAKLKAQEAVGVSTGVFTVKKPIAGEFRGVPYDAIVREIRPDHLAILLAEQGACSVADGCGIFPLETNEREELLLPPVIDWQEISAFGKSKGKAKLDSPQETSVEDGTPLIPPTIDWKELARSQR